MEIDGQWTTGPTDAGQTVLALLRRLVSLSWTACRKLLADRRVTVNDILCIHEARRLIAGDRICILVRPLSTIHHTRLTLYHADPDIVVVEKPAGIVTVRRPEESGWTEAKKALAPTLDELVQQQLTRQLPPPRRPPILQTTAAELFRVQRLDRDTSGIVVFARTATAARHLIDQFRRHSVTRAYHAIVVGCPQPATIRSRLVRDRGDGRRGSSRDARSGQLAVTHLRPLEQRSGLALVECRLETGRTHQIRIHLSEQGCPVCGDSRYGENANGSSSAFGSSVPRLALHAVRLDFLHPATGQPLTFESPMPSDLARWWASLASSAR